MSSLPSREPERTVPLPTFSAALDEIYTLRAILAEEAMIVDAHLSYKTFPKSRRKIADEQVERLQAAARGELHRARRENGRWYKRAVREAGADDTLTRFQWEQQRGLGGDS